MLNLCLLLRDTQRRTSSDSSKPYATSSRRRRRSFAILVMPLHARMFEFIVQINSTQLRSSRGEGHMTKAHLTGTGCNLDRSNESSCGTHNEMIEIEVWESSKRENTLQSKDH